MKLNVFPPINELVVPSLVKPTCLPLDTARTTSPLFTAAPVVCLGKAPFELISKKSPLIPATTTQPGFLNSKSCANFVSV